MSAPSLKLSEPRKHTWGYNGLCFHCGIDRFSREGLRDGEACLGGRGHQRDCPQWWGYADSRCWCPENPDSLAGAPPPKERQ